MMRVFMAILCSLLTVCSVSARDSRHEGTDMADSLLFNGFIKECDKEIYSYHIQILLEKIIGFSVIFLISFWIQYNVKTKCTKCTEKEENNINNAQKM